jgi:hypothetical protein
VDAELLQRTDKGADLGTNTRGALMEDREG